MLRDRRDRAWFSRLLPFRYLARKWSGSILSTPEPTLGSEGRNYAVYNAIYTEANHHNCHLIVNCVV